MKNIRGFNFNNCKNCGAPATVNGDSPDQQIGFGLAQYLVGSGVQVICSKNCGAPFVVNVSLARAGREWNMVN